LLLIYGVYPIYTYILNEVTPQKPYYGSPPADSVLTKIRVNNQRKGRQMISHAMTIVLNELNSHIATNYGPSSGNSHPAELGNIAEGVAGSSSGGVPKNILCFSVVHSMEEKALRNQPNYTTNPAQHTAFYQNPPVFMNFTILVAATHSSYSDALLMISRVIRFFQYKNVFTPDNVSPTSLTHNAPNNPLDQLETFRLVLELYSPSLEEINHLWGTLGGKQYPFVLYRLKMIDLKFKTDPAEGPLITRIISNASFLHPSEENTDAEP